MTLFCLIRLNNKIDKFSNALMISLKTKNQFYFKINPKKIIK